MQDLTHRFAVAILLICGFLSAIVIPWDAGHAVEARQLQFILGLLGASLVLSAFVPALRLPAVGASVLCKVGYLVLLWDGDGFARMSPIVWVEAVMLLALGAAAVVLMREAWQEARWHGMLPWHPEA